MASSQEAIASASGGERKWNVLWVSTAYTGLSILFTWPLARHFSERLGGNVLDPWQTLWGFWWLRHWPEFWSQPMFSPLLWWPEGVPLWFQSWDLPSAVIAWVVWPLLPDIAVYNLVLFVSFPAAGLTFYLFCREMWGGTVGPFLAGCLYTFSTYHVAHATATLHIASIQWAPLVFLGIARSSNRQGLNGPIVAGIGLALATLASPYHLVFCLLAAAVVLAPCAWKARSAADRTSLGWNLGTTIVVFVLGAGWLLAGMALSAKNQEFVGQHGPEYFSADLQSLFLPNPVNLWSGDVTRWTKRGGAAWEYGNYVGYCSIGLALFGAIRKRAARPYLMVAGVGAVLALGPHLYVGGVKYANVQLPYAWLVRAFPVLEFGGMPGRFFWLAIFGVAAAAGAGLRELSCRGLKQRALAIALTCAALIEVWPRPFETSVLPRPEVFKQWAQDRGNWAVLDATFWSQALLHQTLHRHPIIGGYVTRTPRATFTRLQADPLLSVFFRPPIGVSASPRLSMSSEEARQGLRDLRIRYVVIDETRIGLVKEIGLVPRYFGEGLFVYEVPGVAAFSARDSP